jgi:hypothetical protein
VAVLGLLAHPTDLLVHQTDIVNFMLGKTVPKSCMASGGITAGPSLPMTAMCPIA